MKITIDTEVLDKHNISKGQLFYMLSLLYKESESKIAELCNDSFYISRNLGNNNSLYSYFIVDKGIELIKTITLESETYTPNQKNRIEKLAIALQELYPKGKKEGTNNYWRGSKMEIVNKLKLFIKVHGDYDDDIIIKATQNYINSFGGNTTTMRTLKYFISKQDYNGISYDLANWIENSTTNEEENEFSSYQKLI